MPEKQDPTTTTTEPATNPVTSQVEPSTTSPASTDDTKVDGNKTEDLPDWARKAIDKGNSEAMTYRLKLREAEAKLTAAKTQEDIDAAVAELKSTNAKLERDLLVAKVGEGLPPELRDLLKGDTEEELKAHAEVLRKFVPSAGPVAPENLQGGLKPSSNSGDFDPESFAKDWRSGRISRATVSGL